MRKNRGFTIAAVALVRTSMPPEALVSSFRREVTSIDPEQSIGIGPVPLTQLMSRHYQFKAFTTTLFSIFADKACSRSPSG